MSQILSVAEEIFYAARDLPVERREAFLADSCDGDGELLERVKLLLINSDVGETAFILDRPLLNSNPALLPLMETVGDTIGRYKLLEQIGEGGMGIVYMARQETDVQRRVALKIIKPGMDSRSVIARFQAERQAMALFDHANIARVLDAGTTDSGRPYFVMELVQGTCITSYARDRKLTLRQRLELMVEVCRGVVHAHQKGIIHRDLKPGNLLVTQIDGRAAPKIIDFGIAKALDQPLADQTYFTRFSAMLGTPQYMSPEQAETGGTDIDTRADIYSLGIVLYELITGSTPLERDALRSLGPLQLIEAIRRLEPVTPSSHVLRTDEATVERQLNAAPQVVTRQLRGDLDWIVMKAIARDRSHRYSTVHELEADIQRYLNGDPVHAAPPSRWYRFSRQVRKHRGAAAVAAIVLFSLVVSTIACSVFAWRTWQAKQELSGALAEAMRLNERLGVAERQIREKSEQDMYQSAIAMAMYEFNEDFLNQAVNELQPRELTRIVTQPLDLQMSTCEFCSDMPLLFVLPHEKLLAGPLAPLYRFEAMPGPGEREAIADAADTAVANPPLPASSEPDNSEEAFRAEFDQRMRELTIAARPQFYRELLRQYRRTFSEPCDPRVADALNLLASSLIEAGDLEQAEMRLREAVAICMASPSDDVETSEHRKQTSHASAELLKLATDR